MFKNLLFRHTLDKFIPYTIGKDKGNNRLSRYYIIERRAYK